MTQWQEILEYMRMNKDITQMDAYKLGCTRLAARIADIEKRGYMVGRERRLITKANGKTTFITAYSLEEDDER